MMDSWLISSRGSLFQQFHVFFVLLDAESHHDRLKRVAVDGPQFAVGERFDRGGARAVVEDGQLAKDAARAHRGHGLAILEDLDFALCEQ